MAISNLLHNEYSECLYISGNLRRIKPANCSLTYYVVL
jgi:hypothetical protein